MRSEAGCTTPGPAVQRRAHDSFLETLATCTAFRSTRPPGWRDPGGGGISAEFTVVAQLREWGTADQVPDLMSEAFDWLVRHHADADNAELSVCWNDARLSNAIFDDLARLSEHWIGSRLVCARQRPTSPGGLPRAGRR